MGKGKLDSTQATSKRPDIMFNLNKKKIVVHLFNPNVTSKARIMHCVKCGKLELEENTYPLSWTGEVYTYINPPAGYISCTPKSICASILNAILGAIP